MCSLCLCVEKNLAQRHKEHRITQRVAKKGVFCYLFDFQLFKILLQNAEKIFLMLEFRNGGKGLKRANFLFLQNFTI